MTKKSRKKRIEGLEIEGVAAEGKCFSHADGKVIFTEQTAPGDVVNVVIGRKRKNFAEGIVEAFHKKSPLRVEPFCRHFQECGGCQWQHLPYEMQLEFKRKQVIDQLERIGHLELPKVAETLGADHDRYYRNKLEFTFSDTRWLTADEVMHQDMDLDRRALGFHKPRMFNRVLDIHECHLMHSFHNAIRNSIREFVKANNYSFYHQENHSGLLRNLLIRYSSMDEWLVMVQFGEADQNAIAEIMAFIDSRFPELDSLQYVINTKKNDTYYDQDIHVYKGSAFIREKLGALTFEIGPKTFFQTNTRQAENLYDKVLEYAGCTGSETVYDLYSGTGTIALFLAASAVKVVGIENIPESTVIAEKNARFNDIKNVSFVTGDMAETLTMEFCHHHGFPDVIIADPPRAGLHPRVVETLLQIESPRIVYVSCNPATQARDLKELQKIYRISRVQPVDMFPHTHHVENIVLLKKKIS